MTREYNLDTAAAKDANSGGKRITEPGLYTGKFRAAFYEKNDRGTESVNLIFVSDSGQEVGPLALYTHNGNGEPLPSYKTLNAIMACMRVRKLEAKPGKVSLYEFDSKQEVEKSKTTYPALVGPRIGLVLQGEEYENRNDEIKVRMVIAAPFDADSKRMAEEVLSQAQDAKALEKFLAWFDGHKVKPLRTGRAAPQRQSAAASTAVDDFVDDDIPF
jgi:hypothetical protein